MNTKTVRFAEILLGDLLTEDSSESEHERPTDEDQEDVLKEESNFDESSEDDLHSSQEEETEETGGTLDSKNGSEVWSKVALRSAQGRQPPVNVMSLASGSNRYAKREVDIFEPAFRLFMNKNVIQETLRWSNKEGHLVYKENWKKIVEEFRFFLGLLLQLGFSERAMNPLINFEAKKRSGNFLKVNGKVKISTIFPDFKI